MADSDSSLYTLRYNQISQKMEAAGGTPEWNPLILTNAGGAYLLLTGGELTGDLTVDTKILVNSITSRTGAIKISPTTNSTTAIQLMKADASTAVVTIDTTNSILAVGTPNNDGDIVVKKAPGTGSTVSIRSQNTSIDGDAVVQVANDQGHTCQMGIFGTSFGSNNDISFLDSSNSHLMLVSRGSSQGVDFSFGGFGGASVKATVTSTGTVVAGASSAAASAMLQADSTTKGFLPPRMTTTQKNAIASPAEGLVVYDLTLQKLCVYTTAWETITSA